MSQFIQIAVGREMVDGGGVDTLYALDADGRVWVYEYAKNGWEAWSDARISDEATDA